MRVAGPSEDESAGEAIPFEEAEAEDDDGMYVASKKNKTA